MAQLTRSEMLNKMKLILLPERSFYIMSIIYGIGVSVLSLAIPISVQSLVNTVTFSLMTQPLVILSIVLLALLLFSGLLNALQDYTVELFLRKFYARTASEMTVKLINSNHADLMKSNGVDLTNRYFDIMTIQKSVTTLLTSGIAMVLQTFVGLLLLAFYHPYFLAFDIVLVSLLWLVWILFRRKAISSAIDESKSKYAVANWLKELARVNLLFKSRKRRVKALERSDELINNYILNRSRHFQQVFYQVILLLTTYAFLSATVLALGGFLVIEGQLTLGQLVAAELVVTVILGSFAKAGKYLDSFYDLYAAVDKVSYLYDLPAENNGVQDNLHFEHFDLSFQKARVCIDNRDVIFDYTFKEGQSYYIYSSLSTSKTLFMNLVQKLSHVKKGQIFLGQHVIDEVSSLDFRDMIYVIDQARNFEGSISENLTLGDKSITRNQILKALELVGLEDLVDLLEEGLETKILSTGYPLLSSQIVKLAIARSIILKPKIIIMAESFDLIDKATKNKILSFMMKSEMTVILFSHANMSENEFSKYLCLDEQQVREFKTESELYEAMR